MGRLFAALSFSQCIATGTAAGFREAVQRDPAVERYFRAVQISPPDEKDSVLILLREKEPYEKFHAVVYEDAAIETAVLASVQFMPHRHLPEKAIDLLDEAGSRVKLRHEMEPTEIVACRQRVRSIVRQMEAAQASQDYVKSRSCSEEEHRERETLRLLREKYKLNDVSPRVVTKKDIEKLISERAGLPLERVRQRLQKK